MYEPTWQSLAAHGLPEWLREARFGVWAHWGPQSVAQSGDWYGRHLYGMQEVSEEWERKRATRQSAHHREHFGDPHTFGYKDLLPLWRAEHFDPDALIDRFYRAGARYFMSMAVHADNFALWDSAVHPWNAVRMGPQQDIVGAWERAARRAGLPFGLSFHNNWTWRWFATAHGVGPDGKRHDGRLTAADGAGLWWEGLNPQDLYLPPRDGGPAPAAVREQHWAMMREATAEYRPDIVYFDDLRMPFDEGSQVEIGGPDTAGLEYLAWYYNQAKTWDLPHAHGIVSIKNPHDAERGAVLLDSERHQLDRLEPHVWQFDTSDGEWFDNLSDDEMFHQRKTSRHILRTLVDVVSKNGALLLNIPQRADGTLDERSERLLDDLTAWMASASEAIHGTSPWRIYGEGPVRIDNTEPGYNDRELDYTPADLRFTTSDDALYVSALAWPDNGVLQVTSLAAGAAENVHSVELLGHGSVPWRRDHEGLHVTVPTSSPTPHVGVLKVRL
ncbi:alpha-L-fucosidase [Microbacterium sp. YY-01]|uniref:alpha-L-fucosidase n=1 Tax=Microbacterium sp. YY-01 TaxID=3421634 RepID=UPI003D16273B